MKPCNCLIRHARNGYERDAAKRALERARRLGDQSGILIALASLGPCPNDHEVYPEQERDPLTVAQYGDDNGL